MSNKYKRRMTKNAVKRAVLWNIITGFFIFGICSKDKKRQINHNLRFWFQSICSS